MQSCPGTRPLSMFEPVQTCHWLLTHQQLRDALQNLVSVQLVSGHISMYTQHKRPDCEYYKHLIYKPATFPFFLSNLLW